MPKFRVELYDTSDVLNPKLPRTTRPLYDDEVCSDDALRAIDFARDYLDGPLYKVRYAVVVLPDKSIERYSLNLDGCVGGGFNPADTISTRLKPEWE